MFMHETPKYSDMLKSFEMLRATAAYERLQKLTTETWTSPQKHMSPLNPFRWQKPTRRNRSGKQTRVLELQLLREAQEPISWLRKQKHTTDSRGSQAEKSAGAGAGLAGTRAHKVTQTY